VTVVPLQTRPIALRPLALPSEHGGWGFLCEPILLGLLVAPSWSGALIAVAAAFGFLARHPLKLALQDLVRGRAYPRTTYCRALAAGYLLVAACALASAAAMSGARILIPLALAAPPAIIQVVYDASNRSREMLPEISGAIAMASVASAIAVAGNVETMTAFGLAGILIARFAPAILYVRALLGRLPARIALALHVVAVAAVAVYAPLLVVGAMIMLLVRAVWAFMHEPPPAKTIGWREIVFGIVTSVLVAAAYRF
jgi:hypothetical protein